MAQERPRLCVVAVLLLAATTFSLLAEDANAAPAAKWRISQPVGQFSQYVGLALGLDGRVWVADETDRAFLVFTGFQKFTTLSAGSFSPQRMTRGADGDFYLNEGDTSILKVTPAGTMTALSVGQPAEYGITGGADGSVWVAEESEVGRIYPNGRVREYPLESGDMLGGGTAIAEAPGGTVWFDAGTPGYSYYLASLNPETGKIAKHFIDSCGDGEIWPIVAGADGRIWAMCKGYFDGFEKGDVVRVQVPANIGFDMVGGYDNAVSGSDNAIWIVGQNIVNGVDVGGAILRFDLVTHKFHKYEAPSGYGWAYGLTFDAHGNIWAGTGNGELQEVILR